MLTASARPVPGTLRQAIVVDDRHLVVTDEPTELGGDGRGPAPHELLPAALAGCIATNLAMYARTKGWQLGDVRVDVDYDNLARPRTFTVAVEIPAELEPDQLRRLEQGAATCPVRRALDSGFVIEERFVAVLPTA